MRTVIAKFGGSSVADAAKIRACAQRIAEMIRGQKEETGRETGPTRNNPACRVAVVVSAMGDATDELLELAAEITDSPCKREVDQLLATGEQVSASLFAMALKKQGVDAVSLTGRQCAIRTEPHHTRARITNIDAAALEREWAAGRVPVVCGFQGFYETDGGREDCTTLGRGGSDTTAVALAAATGADECLIFTDVEGVYTADPRIVPDARRIEEISYDEMLEAASQGAQVMHLRAVELGKKHGVAIRVLHSQKSDLSAVVRGARGGTSGEHAGVRAGAQEGTLIAALERRTDAQQPVSTVALKDNIGRVTLSSLPNRPGLQKLLFERLGRTGLVVDDIIQTSQSPGGNAGAPETPHARGSMDSEPALSANSEFATIVFTVDRTDLADIRAVLDSAISEIGAGECRIDLNLAKVSAVGAGMQSQSGVAGRMFAALGDAGIRIANITTSEIKISCIVDESEARPALRAIHKAFELHLPVVTRGVGDVVGARR